MHSGWNRSIERSGDDDSRIHAQATCRMVRNCLSAWVRPCSENAGANPQRQYPLSSDTRPRLVVHHRAAGAARCDFACPCSSYLPQAALLPAVRQGLVHREGRRAGQPHARTEPHTPVQRVGLIMAAVPRVDRAAGAAAVWFRTPCPSYLLQRRKQFF